MDNEGFEKLEIFTPEQQRRRALVKFTLALGTIDALATGYAVIGQRYDVLAIGAIRPLTSALEIGINWIKGADEGKIVNIKK